MARMSWSRLWTLDLLRTRPTAGRRVQASLCPLQSWGRNPPFPGRSRDTTGHIQGPSPQPFLSQSQPEGTRLPAQMPPPAHKRLPISRGSIPLSTARAPLSAASHLPTQLSQTLQCEVRGGRNILQVKQYFSFTTCPLIITSRVRGGGRYVELPVLSEKRERQMRDGQALSRGRGEPVLPGQDERSFREAALGGQTLGQDGYQGHGEL